MTQKTFTLDNLSKEFSLPQLQELLTNIEEGFQLEIPLSSIGITNSRLDIALDFLEASFIGEKIAVYCSDISSEINSKKVELQTHTFIVLKMKAKEPKTLAKILFKFSREISSTNRTKTYWISLQKHQFDLLDGEIKPRLCGLASDYLANWVNGLHEFDIDVIWQLIFDLPLFPNDYLWLFTSGIRKKDFKKIPIIFSKHKEWQYGFFKVFTKSGFDYYSSTNDILIIPHKNKERTSDWSERWKYFETEIPKDRLCHILGGFYHDLGLSRLDLSDKKIVNISELILAEISPETTIPRFSKSTLFVINDFKIVIGENSIVEYPCESYISTTRMCAANIVDQFYRWPSDGTSVNDIIEMYLSNDGYYLILIDANAQYIFFNTIKVPIEETIQKFKRFNESLPFFGKSKISCPWNHINDDEFEELCYDILSQSERFNPNTIRKMGKSRSRDGGRDIVIEGIRIKKTDPVIKYIVQCKLIKSGKSLSGAKINFSDTIDQYDAGGFIVMTNGVIDSTLYDKLDTICKKKGVETQTWSKLEIERFLSQRPEIKKRYFKEDC